VRLTKGIVVPLQSEKLPAGLGLELRVAYSRAYSLYEERNMIMLLSLLSVRPSIPLANVVEFCNRLPQGSISANKNLISTCRLYDFR
jgi:hypothetical protein